MDGREPFRHLFGTMASGRAVKQDLILLIDTAFFLGLDGTTPGRIDESIAMRQRNGCVLSPITGLAKLRKALISLQSQHFV